MGWVVCSELGCILWAFGVVDMKLWHGMEFWVIKWVGEVSSIGFMDGIVMEIPMAFVAGEF